MALQTQEQNLEFVLKSLLAGGKLLYYLYHIIIFFIANTFYRYCWNGVENNGRPVR